MTNLLRGWLPKVTQVVQLGLFGSVYHRILLTLYAKSKQQAGVISCCILTSCNICCAIFAVENTKVKGQAILLKNTLKAWTANMFVLPDFSFNN